MRLRHRRGSNVRASCADWDGARPTATVADLHARGGPLRRERQATVLTGPRASSARERFAATRRELLAGRFFPRWFASTVVCGDGTLAVGSTLLQRLHVGPFGVAELIDDPERVALTFVTLDGHPERGVERYDLRLEGDDRATLTVDKVWELPNRLLRIGTPAASVLQRYATSLSLRRFREGRW
ncbi:MAG: DUF1990 domain-containing protein [Chloroflexi bacterium]|nr:DUF1990 domain-containing protein [Chloroflexota bacterium]